MMRDYALIVDIKTGVVVMADCPICGYKVFRQQKPIIKKGVWYHPSCIDEKPMDKYIKGDSGG